MDSTGFGESSGSRYYYHRLDDFGNKNRFSQKRFMKHSIAIDTDNQAIIASINRQSRRHDNIYFKPLMEKCSELVKIRNVTADMGYDAESNHVLVREKLGGVSIIPVRTTSFNISAYSLKTKYRKMLSRKFPLNKYHQRSKIETVNFVEKRKFGSDLQSRITRLRRRELKLIDIVYNIYRYMKLNSISIIGFLQDYLKYHALLNESNF